MSDPVTNIEIEDVLSSIRKLVSDGDRSRTRDTDTSATNPNDQSEEAQAPSTSQPAANPAGQQGDAVGTRPEKLVLTPAFLVSDRNDEPHHDAPDHDAPEQAEATAEVAGTEDALANDGDAEPPLADMVWEEVEAAESTAESTGDALNGDGRDEATTGGDDWSDDESWDHGRATSDEAAAPTSFDRSKLEASIAELEAAVAGAPVDDFEPDGSEQIEQAFVWPSAMKRTLDDVQDAEPADEAPADKAPADKATVATPQPASVDGYEDDDLDDLLAEGQSGLDDEALRALVADIVREELMGPLGERITRNVRKLVRREIYRILSSKEFD